MKKTAGVLPESIACRASLFFSMMLIIFSGGGAFALDNGVSRTPIMGWNPWNTNAFTDPAKRLHRANESIVKEIADTLVSTGLARAGYVYVCIDGGWRQSGVNPITPDPAQFPSGMKALADYVHAKGLKLGIYSNEQSIGREQADANQFASWGVDFLKYDCFHTLSSSGNWIAAMRNALLATKKPIAYNVHFIDEATILPYIRTLVNSWRITNDILDVYQASQKTPDNMWAYSTLEIIDRMDTIAKFAGPGTFPDADMLEIGNGGQTPDEYKTQFSMWCLLPSQLVLGNNLRTMDKTTKDIITNAEAIAVNQDTSGYFTRKVRDDGNYEVWTRRLKNNTFGVVLLNRSNAAATVSMTFNEIGLTLSRTASVRDVWQAADKGIFSDRYSSPVAPHGCAMLVLTPNSSALLPRDMPALQTGSQEPEAVFDIRGKKIPNAIRSVDRRGVFINKAKTGTRLQVRY